MNEKQILKNMVKVASTLDQNGEFDKADKITDLLREASKNPDMIREAGFWDYIKNIGTGAVTGAGVGAGAGALLAGVPSGGLLAAPGFVGGGAIGAVVGGLGGLVGSIVSDVFGGKLNDKDKKIAENLVAVAINKDEKGEDGMAWMISNQPDDPSLARDLMQSYIVAKKASDAKMASAKPAQSPAYNVNYVPITNPDGSNYFNKNNPPPSTSSNSATRPYPGD